jgi:hypothetical protein
MSRFLSFENTQIIVTTKLWTASLTWPLTLREDICSMSNEELLHEIAQCMQYMALWIALIQLQCKITIRRCHTGQTAAARLWTFCN